MRDYLTGLEIPSPEKRLEIAKGFYNNPNLTLDRILQYTPTHIEEYIKDGAEKILSKIRAALYFLRLTGLTILILK